MTLALALGARGKSDLLEPALEVFERGRDSARPHAAWALGVIGDARAVGPLLRRLPMESVVNVQPVMLWALGAIASPEALPALLKIVWGRDTELLAVSRWGIARILEPKPLDKAAARERYLALHDFENARIHVTRAFPALTAFDRRLKVNTARLLTRYSKVVRATLLEQLSSTDAVASRVMEALMSGDGLALAPLAPKTPVPAAWHADLVQATTALMERRTPEIREVATRLLGRLGGAEALDRLTRALSDDTPAVRRAAALSLANTGHAPATARLLEGLSTGKLKTTWGGRVAGITALSTLPTTDAEQSRAVDVLTTALADSYPIVRLHALKTLKPLGARATMAVPATIALLKDDDPRIVQAAVQLLGVTGDPKAVEPLTQRRATADPDLRATIDAALSALGST